MRNQMGIAAIAALAAAATATAENEVQFENVRAAYVAFTSTTNAAVRQSAYGYAKSSAISRADELGYLRVMARTLGKEADCGDVCTKAASSTNSAVRLSALTWLCDVARSWDADKTTAFVDKWLAISGGDVVSKALLLCRRMEARRRAGDAEGAEDAAAAVMSSGKDVPWTYYSQACFARAEMLSRAGEAAPAEQMLSRLLEWDEVASPSIARRMIAIGISRELALRFASAIREKIAKVPVGDLVAFKARVLSGEAEIVELLVHAGRLDEALGECRVMLLTAATPTAYGNAVRLAADVLKRVDGNLGRASAFIESQKSNHVVRAAPPIPSQPTLSDPVRVAERKKCLDYAKENAEDWNAQLVCAYRLLWADCAEDSIRAALVAFAFAPFNEKNLQTCADAVMHPVSVMTRDPAKVAAVRDYLLYGTAGRDGIVGTADDLMHPAEFYSACFRSGYGDLK